MNVHAGAGRARHCMLLGFLSLAACAQEGSVEPGELGSDLRLIAGRGGSQQCTKLDSIDAVPDRIDEDCDGKFDEDADVSKALCPRGTRVIEGTRGDDTLRGTSGRDCILGYGGNDTILAGSGDDVIFGGPGHDRIYTGRGNAWVRAGSGDDLVDTSGSLMSVVFGEDGNDTLIGGVGIDTFEGGEGNDRLSGGGGPDILNGGGCHDLLVGGGLIDFGRGGADFDACDVEVANECELTRRTHVLCDGDADCAASERCAENSGFCVPRSARACGGGSCSPSSMTDETCDGVDDDCDGRIDDDYASVPTHCGVGGCGAAGEIACVNGALVDTCMPNSPVPNTDSVCNGVDDDCDGRADEGFAPTATSCGVGVCGATGVRSCYAGEVVDSCVAGNPRAETDTDCNGTDDDCDGDVDEEYVPSQTSCGQGVCAEQGVTACVAGMVADSCEPGSPSGQGEAACNGLDDDCDGELDEDFVGEVTHCGYGACENTGSIVCQAGQPVDSCVVECEGHCADGTEDDGDGLVDCADPDCAENPLWKQCVRGQVGSPCTSDSDCAAGSACEVNFPGGYCFKNCGGGCPTGSTCWAGVVCVQPCVGAASDACPRPEHACGKLQPDQPSFCRPTCEVSCPTGSSCNEETWTCM